MKFDPSKIITILRESNAIEGVYSEKALKQSLKAWEYLVKQPVLTVAIVLKTHKILMKDLLPKEDQGVFRTRPVWIGSRAGMSSDMIPAYMQNWVFEMAVHPMTFEKAKVLHIKYEHIHPFIDGNGRTGRMFLNYILMKEGLEPYMIKEADKYEYYDWF